MSGYTIALTYNVKHAASPHREGSVDADSEFDSPRTIETIVTELRAVGHTVHPVEATKDLPQWFLSHRVDLVFNIAEGTHGAHRESQVPAILESLRIPFTGSNSVTLTLALDKAKTKQILAAEGIPTPAWQLFSTPHTPLSPKLEFPLIVKPNREGSGKGIWRENVVGDEASLRRQVAHIYARYRQEVLVEEFIHGKELTVGILGQDVLPILEIDFEPCRTSGEFFYSWRMKEFQGDASQGLVPALHCPARLDATTTARVQDVARRAHRALGCSDLSRTDIRLRKDGTPFVLEINPLPGLSPLDSNLPVMTAAAGLSHQTLIQRIVTLAMIRYGRLSPASLSPVGASDPAGSRSAPHDTVRSQEPSARVSAYRPDGAGRPAREDRSLDAGAQEGTQ